MAEKLQFELVSPERVLASQAVDMVVLPGADGDFGVLVDHAPLVSTLRPGIIAVYEGTEIVQSVFVAGGFAEVGEKGLIVLAEDAQQTNEIDIATAEQALRDAEEDLGDAKDPSEAKRHGLERAIEIARARLEAARGQALAH